MHKSLQLSQEVSEAESNTTSPSIPDSQTSTTNHPQSPKPPSAETIISTLPGVKLPKTPAQWLEANIFFQLLLKYLPGYDNLNEFTNAFQSMIYKYFAQNYGTVNLHNDQPTNTNKSVKGLKKQLKHLKVLGHNNHNFDKQIINTRKTLRSKILSLKLSKREEKYQQSLLN
ncbi:hypothetical protein HELRODRAFT_182083 [Helobdella robusta]|uniref:Uncharacterized protein n=1 Tax=Helobdella robusta TaxID=6412 RepID=T1FHP7_HELRO|nr:hypothetical protein HELRODRAFT_182083 [Helobdella robusta]ESN91228.1 hypothetical protein HELRODRAFT_182083 [Helobdella robusta]